MLLDAVTIESSLKQAFPDAEIAIGNPRGDDIYLVIQVGATSFKGLTRIEQHRLVYKALGQQVLEPPPVLSVRTYVLERAA